MLYALPAPHKGATHIKFYEVLVVPGEAVKATGWYGTLDGEDFVADTDLRQPVRNIQGREYAEGFRPYVNGQGGPRANFRDEDLAYWLTAWGWQDDGAWEAANPAPAPEA